MMRIDCPHCREKAIIKSRNDLNSEKTVSDLYCQCKNPDCQAAFVLTLGFKHDINPPAITTAQIAKNLLNRLNKEEQALII